MDCAVDGDEAREICGQLLDAGTKLGHDEGVGGAHHRALDAGGHDAVHSVAGHGALDDGLVGDVGEDFLDVGFVDDEVGEGLGKWSLE